jgi:hypothetical protein
LHSAEARELTLYLENEGALYPHLLAAISMVDKHRRRGKYDSAKAAKGFSYFVERAARKYAHEFADQGSWNTIFPKKIRDEVARHLASEYEAEHGITLHGASGASLHGPAETCHVCSKNQDIVGGIGKSIQRGWLPKSGMRVRGKSGSGYPNEVGTIIGCISSGPAGTTVRVKWDMGAREGETNPVCTSTDFLEPV